MDSQLKRLTTVTVLVGLGLSLLVAQAAWGQGKKTVDPRIREIKNIFITGKGTAPVKARDRIEEMTCYKLASNKDKADAVLEFQQDLDPRRGRATVTAELSDVKSGDVLWSLSKKSETFMPGIGDPADKAMKWLLGELNKVGCMQEKK